MTLFLLALILPLLGGLTSLVVRSRLGAWTGVGGVVLGGALGVIPAARVLAGADLPAVRRPWHVPYGELHLAIDPLSAVFLVVVLTLSALAAVYGVGYLRAVHGDRSHGAHWLFYGLLVSSMAVVVTARNGMLFLVAWELMAVSSFFLVTEEHEKPAVRMAGWTYLVATHIGTAFLLAFFAILGRQAGTLDFDQFAALRLAPPLATTLFLLAIVGFGAKAGFVPMHVWLPEAHPAAPSHVSALMSGAMIKLGIYGILRTLTFLGAPPVWWSYVLIGIGFSSGVLGVLFALAQHDLKRLLAYHSVENIGIITLGLGVGVWGISRGAPAVAVLGMAGALLHVVNHATFKGLLFLAAGSVLRATGTRTLDRMGGLFKRMPVTGMAFLIGAAAISGLPTLNGFVSEFLISVGALRSTVAVGGVGLPIAVVVVTGLALIGGLAVACFAKAFGVVFLGSPRSERVARARESSPWLGVPMLALAGVCILLGVAAPLGARLVLPAAAQVAGADLGAAVRDVGSASTPLGGIALASGLVLALAGGLALLRAFLLRRRTVGRTVTWDCGYERPTARMQYTAASFADPILTVFQAALRPAMRLSRPDGYFPKAASFHEETPDTFAEKVYRPILHGIDWSSENLHWLQHGRVHVYLLYIFVALMALLVWKLVLAGGA